MFPSTFGNDIFKDIDFTKIVMVQSKNEDIFENIFLTMKFGDEISDIDNITDIDSESPADKHIRDNGRRFQANQFRVTGSD